MTRSATSILIFGIYLACLGVILLVKPDLLLSIAGLPSTSDPWIRLMGMLLLIVAFFYIQSARFGFRPFFQWTIYTRFSAVFILLALVIPGLASPVVLLFWLGGLAGALWTALALNRESRTDYETQT